VRAHGLELLLVIGLLLDHSVEQGGLAV